MVAALLIDVCPHSVICLSSVTHHRGYTEWESASGSHVEFPFRSTYADSKLAMVLFAKVRFCGAEEAFCPPSPPSHRAARVASSTRALDGIAIVTLYKTSAACFFPPRYVRLARSRTFSAQGFSLRWVPTYCEMRCCRGRFSILALSKMSRRVSSIPIVGGKSSWAYPTPSSHAIYLAHQTWNSRYVLRKP